MPFNKKTIGLTCNAVFAAAALVMLLLVLASIAAAVNPVQTASATFPGTNGKIAFISTRDGNHEVYVMNPDGSGQTNLTKNDAYDAHPEWSPDGTKIAFSSDRDTSFGDFQIYVMNADGSGVTRLTNNPGWDVEPSWSPDGTKIAFSREGEIHVMNADGSGVTALTFGRSPSWSPDGTKIAFSAPASGGGSDIYVMNSDGTGQTNLTNNFGFNGAPDWSPDGTKIIFNAAGREPILPGVIEVYIINADGTDAELLTPLGLFDGAPSWSPDGTQAAFASDRDVVFRSEIYSMNPDGSGAVRLTYNDANDSEPDWGTHPPSAASPVLTVGAVPPGGLGVFHMYVKIFSADGTLLKKGFTPLSITGSPGTSYTVALSEYLARDFERWRDGNTERTRIVTLSSNDITITAAYADFDSKSGYTSLTYTNTADVPRTGTVRLGPDLTVNAVSLDDSSRQLRMWTIIKAENSLDGSTTKYTVAASNYKDRIFDHWDDGSTNRMRTLNISEDTIITAYYRTG